VRRRRRSSGGSGGDRAAVREEERGEVRDEEEMLLPLYRSEGKGGRAQRRWRESSTGRPLMAVAGGSVERPFRGEEGPRRRWVSGAVP
jgi:hypothetical protein